MNEELLLTVIREGVKYHSGFVLADASIEQILAKARPIIEGQVRWEVGEELCCLVGNKMLEDMEAGKLLASQLEDYMNKRLKGGKVNKEEILAMEVGTADPTVVGVKMEYTKGEWKLKPIDHPLGGYDIYCGEELIASSNEANAHFIAAAPDLYEALKKIIKEGVIYPGGGFEDAFEAIAKAEKGGK